ncbi:MAG: family 43 glycosylhydrolase [Bernardetiaceae bacterium]|nr:family 43 glycosylhydrolase [Bernardetiaceae bacterium]
MKTSWLWALAWLLAGPLAAQPRTYCNPIDIDYRYNYEQLNDSISYRSAADPVIINHRGEYYLFATISGGWWHSPDLATWRFVTPDKWPMEDMCAPAALSVRDTLYLFQSTFEQRPIFYSLQPAQGKLRFYNRWLPRLPPLIGPWDPALFHDPDTERWYMYWGSSNNFPLFGAELDKNRRLTYKNPADYRPLIFLHPEKHGWERFGPNHTSPIKPFMEGAWMTKHRGQYFLQYGAPGTEYNVYANGTYVGSHPLGPFTYAPYNPISYRPGGFATGAGHGNTFQDNYGNYWNTGTCWVAVNWNFERRIVMFPAGFDADNQLFANTRFGDWPHWLPTRRWQQKDELFTGWMLLNYRKPATASSTLDTLQAQRVTDENPRTFWVARHNRPGEWLATDLGAPCRVHAVQVNFTDYRSNLFATDSTVYTAFKISTSLNGTDWQAVADLTQGPRRDRACAYVELPAPVRARYLRYEHGHVAAPHLAISALRVFGQGEGRGPATPRSLQVRRQTDARNADVNWQPVPGAVGYNILWGIAPGKLYQTYQVWAEAPPQLELRALTVGQTYYFAIEAFNENGVSKVSEVVGPR